MGPAITALEWTVKMALSALVTLDPRAAEDAMNVGAAGDALADMRGTMARTI